jgi:hypothetical protein
MLQTVNLQLQILRWNTLANYLGLGVLICLDSFNKDILTAKKFIKKHLDSYEIIGCFKKDIMASMDNTNALKSGFSSCS